MTLKKDFSKAVDAMRVALKSALDDPDFDQNQLSEVWRHYLGMKAITESLSDETPFQVQYEDIVKGYDPDYNIYAAGPVDLGLGGKDVITFS